MIIFKDSSNNTTWRVNGSDVPPKGTTISDGQKTWSVIQVDWSLSRENSSCTLVATVTVVDLANATRGTMG